MLSGSHSDRRRTVGTLRCCCRDFLYTPRHAELLHLRRKDTILLSARFAAIFVLVMLVVASVWDGTFHVDMLTSQTFLMRVLVAGVAVAVLANRAVRARWRRHFPYVPMLMLIVAACLLSLFAAQDPLAGQRMFSTHSLLLLGLVFVIGVMPVTMLEAAFLAAPIIALLLVGTQITLATGFIALEILLVVLLPLVLLSALVQLYRTIVASQEVAIDSLTGCYTRTFGTEMIRVNFDSAVRKNARFTLAFIDLDDFKQINDRYGHDYGDRILGEVGTNLVKRFRRSDLVVRWGGEEFLILLPDLEREKAAEVVERVMADGLADLENGQVQKASVGLAERIEDAVSVPQKLIELADRRMYEAKKRRDRDDLIAEGLAGRSSTAGKGAPAPCRPVNVTTE